MRDNLVHHSRIIWFAALALIVLSLFQQEARAQEEVSIVFHTISWGMVRGQTARFTVANPNQPSEQEQRTIFFHVTLFDTLGRVIAKSDELAIQPGKFRSIDFKRGDLSLAGEFSGRVQTRAQIRYRSFPIVDRSTLIVFPTSIELIDDYTGQTKLLISQNMNKPGLEGLKSAIGGADSNQTELPVIIYASRSTFGLTCGQTLRVNLVHPGVLADPQRQSVRTVSVRARLYDANGSLLAQSAERIIAPNEFHSFDFDRAAFPPSLERNGCRLQMLISLEVASSDPFTFTLDQKATGQFPASLELIDNSSGGTTAVWLTTGFFEVIEPKKQ